MKNEIITEIETLRRERDIYRAVLEGLEVENIDSLKTVEEGRRFGRRLKRTIKNLIKGAMRNARVK
jgi:hypothetical protein